MFYLTHPDAELKIDSHGKQTGKAEAEGELIRSGEDWLYWECRRASDQAEYDLDERPLNGLD